MNNNRRFVKAQSAMEYLMTYGWAILIIAVVLGALFSLGVFSSGALLGTSCIAGAGYQCQNMVLNSNGNLSFTFGQSTGSTIYNVGFGCAATSTSSGLPNPGNALIEIDSGGGSATLAGVATNVLASNGLWYAGSNTAGSYNALSLVSGQTEAVSKLKCFGTTGSALTSSSAPLGTSFSGSIWMNYTTTSAGTGTGNWLTVKIATLTAKVA
ncbi:MAG: hypothetical protein KGI04_01155 [Candidatus Micrarchaeota archaeon]|nr:hypothetical protein [Candidatus Micrarchaeota archaeon]